MNRKVLLLLAFCFFSFHLLAQVENHKGRRLSVGVCVGPAADWLAPNSEGYEKKGSVGGIRYGVLLDVNLSHQSNYYFSTGILFQHLGGKLIVPFKSGDSLVQRKYTAVFLAIPTGLKFKTPSFNNFVFAVNFGLFHGFNLNSKKIDIYETNGQETKEKGKSDYKEVAFFEEAVYGGVGVEYVIKEDFRVSFYINYSYTFTNYFNKKSESIVDNKRLKGNHNGIEFVIGAFF